MRIKLDENIHPDVAELLKGQGHDALTVWDENLRGSSDTKIATVIQQESRALLTLDLDFSNIRTYPPSQYSGIIDLRVGSHSRKHVLGVAMRLLPMLASQEAKGQLWIVDEQNVRIRGE
jgi:predicted nuclease of predicted toxin-antitoxin system